LALLLLADVQGRTIDWIKNTPATMAAQGFRRWADAFASARRMKNMKSNTSGKSPFTLAPAEYAQVRLLRRLLKARSNTEVIRRSLRLLEECVAREELCRQFREASARVRSSTHEVMRLVGYAHVNASNHLS
jgi:hypothetical protein